MQRYAKKYACICKICKHEIYMHKMHLRLCWWLTLSASVSPGPSASHLHVCTRLLSFFADELHAFPTRTVESPFAQFLVRCPASSRGRQGRLPVQVVLVGQWPWPRHLRCFQFRRHLGQTVIGGSGPAHQNRTCISASRDINISELFPNSRGYIWFNQRHCPLQCRVTLYASAT